MELFGLNASCWVRMKKKAEVHPSSTMPTGKHRGGNMLWGCFFCIKGPEDVAFPMAR